MRVCVVEDSELVQGLLTRELSKIRGVSLCGVVEEADEAVRMIRMEQPDLVILDILLKRGNGFEVLKQAAGSKKRPKIMVLTNYAYPEYRRRSLDMGADYFFDKSLELHLALEKVAEMAGTGYLFTNIYDKGGMS